MLVTIDPGTKHAGVAVWRDEPGTELEAAFGVRTEGSSSPSAEVLEAIWHYVPTAAVIEAPREYQSRPGVRTDALIMLALMCGELYGAIRARWCCPIDYVEAPSWKAQLPKPDSVAAPYVVEHRARRLLSATELGRVNAPPKDKGWDVWDAIGIGLVHTGRAGRGLRPREERR